MRAAPNLKKGHPFKWIWSHTHGVCACRRESVRRPPSLKCGCRGRSATFETTCSSSRKAQRCVREQTVVCVYIIDVSRGLPHVLPDPTSSHVWPRPITFGQVWPGPPRPLSHSSVARTRSARRPATFGHTSDHIWPGPTRSGHVPPRPLSHSSVALTLTPGGWRLKACHPQPSGALRSSAAPRS